MKKSLRIFWLLYCQSHTIKYVLAIEGVGADYAACYDRTQYFREDSILRPEHSDQVLANAGELSAAKQAGEQKTFEILAARRSIDGLLPSESAMMLYFAPSEHLGILLFES